MKNSTKRSPRVGAAVALAVVGLAGLGMAAAAQLNLTWQGNLQAGAVSVNADCQVGAIKAGFGAPVFTSGAAASTAPWKLDAVSFSGVEEPCVGKKYEAAYKLSSGSWVKFGEGTVATGGAISATLPENVPADTVGNLALTIYGS